MKYAFTYKIIFMEKLKWDYIGFVGDTGHAKFIDGVEDA